MVVVNWHSVIEMAGMPFSNRHWTVIITPHSTVMRLEEFRPGHVTSDSQELASSGVKSAVRFQASRLCVLREQDQKISECHVDDLEKVQMPCQ